MTRTRLARTATCFAILSAALLASAADPAPVGKWDPARVTQPETLEELKALQSTVTKLVDKCNASTVAVLMGPSAGSGVIVSEDGLVLTAAHVIRSYSAPKKGGLEGVPQAFKAGAPVKIMLPDGTKVDGKTLGINAKMDSGMVQITTKGPNNGKWPFTPVAKSGDVKTGQWVFSLGHPSGPKEGRSPVARLGRVKDSSKSAMQTDCTLVGGDSGGPLFDLNGKVIGIHSRIGPSLAYNIHVPTDAFKNEWDKLVAGEWVDAPQAAKAASGYLGVVFAEDEEDDAWVTELADNGPAAKGGMVAGDTITKFNDTVVKSVKQFRKLMEPTKAGDKIRFTVRRGTEVKVLTITLGKRD
jgi:serine protease Do